MYRRLPALRGTMILKHAQKLLRTVHGEGLPLRCISTGVFSINDENRQLAVQGEEPVGVARGEACGYKNHHRKLDPNRRSKRLNVFLSLYHLRDHMPDVAFCFLMGVQFEITSHGTDVLDTVFIDQFHDPLHLVFREILFRFHRMSVFTTSTSRYLFEF